MPRVHPVAAGTIVELGSFGSEALGGARRVRVYVPTAPRPGVRRPTLLLLEGQNVFGDEGSFSGGWYADRSVDRVVASRLVAPMIVAIDNGGTARIDEYSPFPHDGRGGRADAFLDVVVNQVLPAVHGRFDIQPWFHVIGGSSMGGLLSLYAHFRQPEVFPAAMCMSPSIWFGKSALFDFVARQPNPRLSRVYLDCGGREGRGQMLPLVQSMAMHLESRGWSTTSGPLRIMWRPDKKGAHNEVAWRRRLPKALRFLFG
jgi:predicted alpha/beta superfamily hydrolase